MAEKTISREEIAIVFCIFTDATVSAIYYGFNGSWFHGGSTEPTATKTKL